MELKKNKNIYSKQKSFLNIRSTSGKSELRFTLNRLKKNLEKKTDEKININQDEIIKYLKSDLFKGKLNGRPKFVITPNILKEISLLEDKNLLRYLIHRYRYDIYPEIQKHDAYPPYLQIEPTSICNYRCVFCYQTNNEFTKKSSGYMGKMNLEIFKETVDQSIGNIEFLSLASRGEPLSAPNINEMLEYTKGKFLNLKINTNASLLNEKKSHTILENGVGTLVFSADAADSELYSKLRVRGKLEKVVSNIKKFNEIKEKYYPKSKIITRVSGVKVNNLQNFKEMEKFWKSLADQVAFVDYCPWEDVYNDKINKITDPCTELWRRMYVWWDGETNPCEVDFKSKLSTGKITSKNIFEIWNSEQYNHLRQKHLKGLRKEIEPCKRCVVI